jgi:predicted XRE-type DNA-binding protein
MINVVKSSDNIFDDLGFSHDESLNLKMRSDLMLELINLIKVKGLTKDEASTFLGLQPAEIEFLFEGDMEKFTIDKLINILGYAGFKVKLEII